MDVTAGHFKEGGKEKKRADREEVLLPNPQLQLICRLRDTLTLLQLQVSHEDGESSLFDWSTD